jgi:hypothetical protein
VFAAAARRSLAPFSMAAISSRITGLDVSGCWFKDFVPSPGVNPAHWQIGVDKPKADEQKV